MTNALQLVNGVELTLMQVSRTAVVQLSAS